jgi:hypothetical protein
MSIRHGCARNAGKSIPIRGMGALGCVVYGKELDIKEISTKTANS